MNVSNHGGYNPLATRAIRFDNLGIKPMLGSPNKMTLNKEPINDNFSNKAEATSAVEVSLDFRELRKANRMAAIDAAVGEEKKDLEMRMYWGEYTDIFFGSREDGSRNYNISMDTMYSHAAEIYKQIEDSSDSEETKALKFKALENALSSGTGMYKMRLVGEKMRNDALEAEAQGKAIDRSYRSKAKFDKLCTMSRAFDNITSTFFNNLKNGKTEGFNYGTMISDVVSKIMSYQHTSS